MEARIKWKISGIKAFTLKREGDLGKTPLSSFPWCPPISFTTRSLVGKTLLWGILRQSRAYLEASLAASTNSTTLRPSLEAGKTRRTHQLTLKPKDPKYSRTLMWDQSSQISPETIPWEIRRWSYSKPPKWRSQNCLPQVKMRWMSKSSKIGSRNSKMLMPRTASKLSGCDTSPEKPLKCRQ